MINLEAIKHSIEEKRMERREKRYWKKLIKKYHNVNIVDYLTEIKKIIR